MRDVDLAKVCGVAVYVTCGYCKGKRRFPGGKYKAQGEVIDCPVCNGSGAEREMLTLEQFAKLVTIANYKVRSGRRWASKKKTART